MRPTALALIAVLALLGAACSHEPSGFVGSPAVPPPPLDATPAPAPEATPAPAAEARPAARASFVLAIGQAADLGADASLHFEALANDGRCPPKAQCVWAGEVTLSFLLEHASGGAGFELSSTTKPKAQAGGREFELVDYGACPAGTPGECATVAVVPAP